MLRRDSVLVDDEGHMVGHMRLLSACLDFESTHETAGAGPPVNASMNAWLSNFCVVRIRDAGSYQCLRKTAKIL